MVSSTAEAKKDHDTGFSCAQRSCSLRFKPSSPCKSDYRWIVTQRFSYFHPAQTRVPPTPAGNNAMLSRRSVRAFGPIPNLTGE